MLLIIAKDGCKTIISLLSSRVTALTGYYIRIAYAEN
jgi:hypothetical protein